MSIHHQGYVVGNLFVLIFFIFYCVFHIHKKGLKSVCEHTTRNFFDVRQVRNLSLSHTYICKVCHLLHAAVSLGNSRATLT